MKSFSPKTFQEEVLQSTANFWHTQVFEWSVQQGHLADEQAQAHLWPTLTQMETTDSNPGSLTVLPTHPRNPAALSSPWSPLVLISSFPPCFPNQAGLLLATSNKKKRKKKKSLSKIPSILASEAKSHLVSTHASEENPQPW